jgi:stress response protein SCP2
MLKVNKGILTLDIVNSHFLEDVPFYCNLDVFVFKLKQGKLQKEKDLVFYNNLSDAEGTVKFLAVGDTDYDCDHRIWLSIKDLLGECDSLKVFCAPDFTDEKDNCIQGHFQLKVKTRESEITSVNFTVSDSLVYIMEMKRNDSKGFVLDFPNLRLLHSIEDVIKNHEPTDLNK